MVYKIIKFAFVLGILCWGYYAMYGREASVEVVGTRDPIVCSNPEVAATEITSLQSYFANLFNTANYPARWNCGYWSQFEGWFYILSDLSIFSAYISIPFILLFIFIKQKEVPFKRELLLFSIFIFFCGVTHLIEAIIFWEPIYRFSGFFKALTGIVSWITVIALAQSMPFALTFKNPAVLEREIEQRKETEEKLQSTNKELDAFTYSVSHDLRAPLRAIDGYSSILKEEFAESLNEEGKGYLDRILVNTSKMGNLIDDLLNFSRLTRITTKFEEFTSSMLLKEIVELNPEFNQIQVQWDTLPKLMGDKALVKQVLQNLIFNAVKYSSKEKSPKVEVWGYETVKYKVIVIKDNGVGFDMKYSNKLFEVFQRLHTDSEFEGNGIGLALSKKIMDRHKGDIEYESHVNVGSTFTLIFPK